MKRASVVIDRLKIRISDGADPKALADAVRQALAETQPQKAAAHSDSCRHTLTRQDGEDTAALGRRIVRKGLGGGS
ncbi:hypothetical protein [Hoeflea sp.]|uniref:hypothetical protein n=1 Tax=Hoeflea sp. TaxID=1940281 RepID=UPI003B01088B